jgi:hypothetical protein
MRLQVALQSSTLSKCATQKARFREIGRLSPETRMPTSRVRQWPIRRLLNVLIRRSRNCDVGNLDIPSSDLEFLLTFCRA